MHSKTKLSYTSTDRKRFAEFFTQEETKKKVGRPKKKKRKYSKNKQNKKTDDKKDGVVKSSVQRKLFEDKCEGEVAKDKRNKFSRVNWDIEPNYSYRDRIATSWITQTDLWRVGEKFGRFALRCAIDRNVLRRYINKVKKNAKEKNPTKPKGEKRGRKPMLKQSVMHHLCEGWLSVCVLLPLECSSRHCNAFCSRTET